MCTSVHGSKDGPIRTNFPLFSNIKLRGHNSPTYSKTHGKGHREKPWQWFLCGDFPYSTPQSKESPYHRADQASLAPSPPVSWDVYNSQGSVASASPLMLQAFVAALVHSGSSQTLGRCFRCEHSNRPPPPATNIVPSSSATVAEGNTTEAQMILTFSNKHFVGERIIFTAVFGLDLTPWPDLSHMEHVLLLGEKRWIVLCR